MIMMITDRQRQILWTVVEEHIKSAEPVGSKVLAGRRGFNIGAPMIRKEMNHLEKEGYLAQPHTSAGRVPTDKAYRLYIQDQVLAKSDEPASPAGGLTAKESAMVERTLRRNWVDEEILLKEVSRMASEISQELSVAGAVGGDIYSFGLANLVEEPEFRHLDNLNRLMNFMDNIESHFEQFWRDFLDEDLSVLIGRENPIRQISEFTLITGKYHLPRGNRGFVSIIGPKRMDYKKNMLLVEYISGCLNCGR